MDLFHIAQNVTRYLGYFSKKIWQNSFQKYPNLAIQSTGWGTHTKSFAASVSDLDSTKRGQRLWLLRGVCMFHHHHHHDIMKYVHKFSGKCGLAQPSLL